MTSICIFYATREGQTRRMAEHVAAELRGRGFAVDRYYGEDIIALRREPALPDAVPLLQGVMRAGRVVPPVPDLAAARHLG